MGWERVEAATKKERSEIEQRYRKRVKFIVDENLGINVTEILKANGWNAKYVSEIGLAGRSDEDIFNYASKHERTILSHDEDFLDNRRFPFYCNPGIIIFPGASGNGRELKRSLFDMLILIAPFAEIYKGSKIIFFENREIKVSFINEGGLKSILRFKYFENYLHTWCD